MNTPLRKPDTANSLTSKKDRLAEISAAKAALDREAKIIEAELVAKYEAQVSALYKNKGESFGTINLEVDGETLCIDTPKKVAWDQPKLAALHTEIAASGSNPTEYMDLEFSVPESKYKAWPENIRAQFEPARTVTPGKMKLMFKEGRE